MNPEECRAVGGHCWVDISRYMRGDGQQEILQRCKHCPARRQGKTREPVEWIVAEEDSR